MRKLPFLLLSLLVFGLLKAQDKPTSTIPDMLGQLPSVIGDTARMDLLLNIGYAYVLKPGEEKTDLDSALLLVKEVKTFNDRRTHDPRIAGLCELITSKALRERHDDSLSRVSAVRALNLFHHQNDSLDLAYAYCQAAGFYRYDVMAEDSIRVSYYRRAITIFDSLGRKSEQARYRELLGDCLLNLNGPMEALPVLLEALKIYQSLGQTSFRNLYMLIGFCYRNVGDVQRGIDYGLKALREEESLPEPDKGTITTYIRLGDMYCSIRDFASGVDLYRKGITLARKFKDEQDEWMVGIDLASALNEIPGRSKEALDTLRHVAAIYAGQELEEPMYINLVVRYVRIYTKLDHRDSLVKYGEELASLLSHAPEQTLLRARILVPLSAYALSIHQFDRARKYDREAVAISSRQGPLSALIWEYQLFFQIDSASGNKDEALADYRRYIEIRDSANDITHSRQVADLRIEYDAERKDASIQSLTESQRLNRTALHQAGIARNAIIAAAVLLLILLGLAINRYRLKQRSNQQLGRLLTDKEWLLKEIHHRVKNNLQLAMSLLNTQSHYIDNEKAQAAIEQSRNRMYAMSLIHQRLYQVDNLETIDMSHYIPELVNFIRDSVKGGQRIYFELHIQPLKLDVAQAIPLGLILNETITNAIKHAFKGRDEGRITIRLERDTSRIRLMITDDGVGLPEGVNPRTSSSMGMRLIETLVEQLEGQMTISGHPGLSVLIGFDKLPDRRGDVEQEEEGVDHA